MGEIDSHCQRMARFFSVPKLYPGPYPYALTRCVKAEGKQARPALIDIEYHCQSKRKAGTPRLSVSSVPV